MSWDVLIQTCDGLDRSLFLRLAPPKTTSAGRMWNRSISQLADGPLYFALAVLVFLLGGTTALLFPVAMALGFAIELPTYKFIKKHFKRPRPCDAIQHVHNRLPIPDVYSFPSGHTAGAFVLAGITLQLLPLFAPLAYAFAISVGYSRVYNRLHYPADTLAGALLGSLSASIACSLAQLLLGGSV